jgi:37-kD nucleoid-associated bacterial protein
MLDFKPAIITNCIVHQLGNAQSEQNNILAKAELMINEQEAAELKKILCKPFTTPMQAHQFVNASDLQQHDLYNNIVDLFTNPNEMASISKEIVQQLFRLSADHPIKASEFFVVAIDNIETEAGITNAIAIIKADASSKFLKINALSQGFEIAFDKGMTSKNIEKACLILNHDAEEGFYVYPYEKIVGETNYWTKYFLQIQAKTDEYRQTNVLLNTFREFVMNDLEDENFSKKDKINLVQNSMDYMVENADGFRVDDFISHQLTDEEQQENYKASLQVYVADNDVQLQNQFAVDKTALQFQRKKFRSIIKLDKNFHIYVHSNEDLIERGTDDKGKFYKVYFTEEQ